MKYHLQKIKITAFSVLLLAQEALAQGIGLSSPTPKFGTISDFINAILGIVIRLMIPVLTVLFIYSGFKFVTARGNETKLAEARRAFVWTVAGAAVLLGSVVISTAITGTVNQIMQ